MRLVFLRKKAGYSQEELAARAGITQEHLSKIENGKVALKLPTLVHLAKALAKALNLPIGVVIGENLFTPVLRESASGGYQTKLLSGGIFGVTVTVPLEASNSLPLSFGYLADARLERTDRILLYKHDIRLTPEQRYRNARSGIEWLYAQGYGPRVALISDSESDRYGMDAVREWGLDAACYPNEADAIRWLHSERVKKARSRRS
jgi:transcriptional regulator with XRE-family HTH domain